MKVGNDELTVENIESSYISVDTKKNLQEKLPEKVTNLNEYRIKNPNQKKSYHSVFRCEKNSGDEVIKYFYKENLGHTCISALESIAAAFCNIVRGNAADTYPVVNESFDYVGVISKEIPEFKTSVEDCITNKDIFLTKHANDLIPYLEIKHKKFSLIVNEIHRLDRCMHHINNEEQYIHKNNLPVEKLEQLNNKKLQVYKLIKKQKDILNNFYAMLQKVHGVSAQYFDSYRIVRGHAHALVMGILNQDADLHGNNFTKYGKLFDFDMCYWIILSFFKKGFFSPRSGDNKAFYLDTASIINFPNLTSALRYWVTQTSSFMPDFVSEVINSSFARSAADYTKEQAEKYSTLANNSVFVYHKYETFLRHLLVPEEVYRNIIDKYIIVDDRNRIFVECLIHLKNTQLDHMKQQLLSMAEFREYFAKYGDFVFKQYVDELENNDDYKDYISILQENYWDIRKEIFKDSCEYKEHDSAVAEDKLDNWFLPAMNVNQLTDLVVLILNPFKKCSFCADSGGIFNRFYNFFFTDNSNCAIKQSIDQIYFLCEELRLTSHSGAILASFKKLKTSLEELDVKISDHLLNYKSQDKENKNTNNNLCSLQQEIIFLQSEIDRLIQYDSLSIESTDTNNALDSSCNSYCMV